MKKKEKEIYDEMINKITDWYIVNQRPLSVEEGDIIFEQAGWNTKTIHKFTAWLKKHQKEFLDILEKKAKEAGII